MRDAQVDGHASGANRVGLRPAAKRAVGPLPGLQRGVDRPATRGRHLPARAAGESPSASAVSKAARASAHAPASSARLASLQVSRHRATLPAATGGKTLRPAREYRFAAGRLGADRCSEFDFHYPVRPMPHQQLWLLRHGEAVPHGSKDDFDRELTARGERQSAVPPGRPWPAWGSSSRPATRARSSAPARPPSWPADRSTSSRRTATPSGRASTEPRQRLARRA